VPLLMIRKRYLTEEGVEEDQAGGERRGGAGSDGGSLPDESVRARGADRGIFASALDYAKQKIRRTDLLLPGAEPSQLFRELAKDKQASAVFLLGMHRSWMTSSLRRWARKNT